jgi:2OG-Fe(II) oxygenase superfamily
MDSTIYAQERAKEAIGCDLLEQEHVEACLMEGAANALKRWAGEWRLEESALRTIAEKLDKYLCRDADEESETTVPRSSFLWESDDFYVHDVDILLKRPAAQIHVIHNFIEPEECQYVPDAAAQQIVPAGVIDHQDCDTGLSSEHRQAKIEIPWHLESQHHPLTNLSRRVYDYTNYALGMNISEYGQEPLSSIHQYSQEHYSKYRVQPPDAYTAHCDGYCDGSQHRPPNRIATMILYCHTATKGGNTHFHKAGIHIRPERGMGVFFTYMDPSTHQMDTGFTEHSICPVLAGHNHIVTQSVRLGVSQENPWNSDDPLGNKRTKKDKPLLPRNEPSKETAEYCPSTQNLTNYT